ncbi:hypothetical protein J3459_016082 [Metarhizium acridum]|uniref:uncharacterized protein n=1 Tax=Metarhizium acridum TaxID=92637 RepID=UPI001C6B289E|nr:hypothetical protein J3458_020367 [Metarhizium acridum]KAG8411999.1 hypothetical protein J3459_016082 [Metarhizium acridum]
MSQFKDIMKNGWHPEKSGTGIRGSVSGLMGRNKDNKDSSSNHVARPLTNLKDPASFAPPPKRTGSGLAPAPKPVSTKRKVVAAPSKYADPRAGPVELPPRGTGTGRESGEASPTRDGVDGRSPPSYDEATSGPAVSKALPPSLPPRLPPRGAAGGGEKNGQLNEGAVSRLGAAGVSVPALGIDRGGAAHSTSPSPPPASSRASPSAEAGAGSGAGKWGAQVNQLQDRFAKMATPSAAPSAQEPPPSQGTSWAQKQAALKTASAFQKDPSSVSFSDAKAAASTANNFRQRHGEQVAAGTRAANNFSQKHGIADKLGAYAGSQSTQPAQNKSEPPPLPGPSQPYIGATNDAAQAAVSGLAGKKKPPPPPKKKPALAAAAAAAAAPDPPSASHGDVPPPIPMSTRPQF